MGDEATQTALREMSREIGALASSVTALEQNWRSQDEKASSGRAVLYEKIDTLRADFSDYRGKLEKVIADVAGIKPTIDRINVAEQRAIGAFWVSRVFYAVGIMMTAGVTFVLANWVKISIK